MISGTIQAPAQKSHAAYESEVRFGVVLYGGVSLAVYINGVANEMFEMVSATPRHGPSRRHEEGTRELYRRIAWLVGNPALRGDYCRRIESRAERHDNVPPQDVWDDGMCTGLSPTRLTIDVISGTSAGGINGIFLAKALTNGRKFEPLQNLWIQEGDIGCLLNDRQSYEDLNVAPRRAKLPPKSLLNSDRMFLKLFDAMAEMKPDGTTDAAQKDESLVDELDLFVTTTDIAGSPVPLRLSGQVVYERRHKQNFHFSYAHGIGRNDFNSTNDVLLAFAARCTSSFPFAFEPMTMESVKGLTPASFAAVERSWHKYLSYLPPGEVESDRHTKRAFGDGGYLDNKPFTYVAKTLSTRQATVPVERKLIYVEPAPEDVDEDDTRAQGAPPDALTNSLAALTSIPRYETIREDLQDVLRRNRSIERVERIMREGETDLHEMLKGAANPFVRILQESNGQIPPWPEFKREKMASFYGPAFLAYRRMRVSSVTDELAYGLARVWGVDFKSDRLYALTALLREWRNWNYQEDPKQGQKTINAFLDRFDAEYRIRKLSFLLHHIDYLTRLLRARRRMMLTPEKTPVLAEADERTVERLRKEGFALKDASLTPEKLDQAIDALQTLKDQLNEVQGKWRLMEGQRREPCPSGQRVPADLRESLNALLSLLLGEQQSGAIRLATISGGTTQVLLTEETRKACACARTMQDSVLRRTKDVLQLAAEAERTELHEALERSIEAMVLPKAAPSAWEILGKPRLELSTGEEKVVTHVDATGNASLDSEAGYALRKLLGEYYVYFDLFDQMSFPLYHDSGIGEPATVEVVRISPLDAKSLIDESRDRRRKLAGTALANFGAFIDRRWRRNDIMWGRLDGAERLIQTLLPMSDHSTQIVRNELIAQAHRMILRETLIAEGAGKAIDLISKALAELPGEGATVDKVRQLINQTCPRQAQRQEYMATMLASFLNGPALIHYMRTERDVDRSVNPREAVTNASRAMTITGRMLDELSNGKGKKSIAFRWLARLGLIGQGFLAVTLPGSLKAHWRSHLLALLYTFELFLVAATMFFYTPGFVFAIKLLVFTIALNLLILVIGDLVHAREDGLGKGATAAAAVILGLAALGGASLYDYVNVQAEETIENTREQIALLTKQIDLPSIGMR